MCDGAAYLSTFAFLNMGNSLWDRERGHNLLDSGAPFYDVYATADGKYVAVGAVEPQFFAALLDGLNISRDAFAQMDRDTWPAMRAAFTTAFASKPLSHWSTVFDKVDACVTPCLDYKGDLRSHPHVISRNMFPPQLEGAPAPAPRLSRTNYILSTSQPIVGQHTESILSSLSYSKTDIDRLLQSSVVSKVVSSL